MNQKAEKIVADEEVEVCPIHEEVELENGRCPICQICYTCK